MLFEQKENDGEAISNARHSNDTELMHNKPMIAAAEIFSDVYFGTSLIRLMPRISSKIEQYYLQRVIQKHMRFSVFATRLGWMISLA